MSRFKFERHRTQSDFPLTKSDINALYDDIGEPYSEVLPAEHNLPFEDIARKLLRSSHCPAEPLRHLHRK